MAQLPALTLPHTVHLPQGMCQSADMAWPAQQVRSRCGPALPLACELPALPPVQGVLLLNQSLGVPQEVPEGPLCFLQPGAT